MAAPKYLSDCDAKLNTGGQFVIRISTQTPLWVEKELMPFAKLSSACCIAFKTRLASLPPPAPWRLTICRSQDCTGAAVGFAFKKRWIYPCASPCWNYSFYFWGINWHWHKAAEHWDVCGSTSWAYVDGGGWENSWHVLLGGWGWGGGVFQTKNKLSW